MSAHVALESSSRTVRHCKRLIDAAIHEHMEQLDPKSETAFIQLVSTVRASSNVLRPSFVAGPNSYSRIKNTIDVLSKLTSNRRHWKQEPWTWTSDNVSYVAAMRSLIEFLLVKSDVPTFLYMGWLVNQNAGWHGCTKLFLHLAAGNSVRGYQTNKRLTKSMAKRFSRTPDHFNMREAFRFARDPQYKIESFKFTVADTRRRRKQHFIKQLAPADSGITWRRSHIADFQQIDEERTKPWSVRVWSIRQLLNESQLIAEGHRQNHCVGSYARKCEKGESTIWAMECRGTMTCHPGVTIEVNSNGTIVTALGKNNRSAKHIELEVVAVWAKREGLKLSTYLWSRLLELRSQNA